ncbi:hypothetical protein TWF569_003364 [Orbilia oligospora]|uniref:Uncharacterized protein n=1 Tax=Orbilia oligospora TaxID=2813651 RepID=A0A7C8JI36_ORBOL|nr:hypothetical protein TWF102_012022 [Orbilia oligospora]KAF3106325.1 hypothetical protein TWF103_012014 [Orbilia oligospora]KAF3111014.1 hypothetical protein TWF706_011983 [Orbilia oligospora]KAF3120090.1 hypothetical protein TWF569_003364 [Orbilia oligospora]KAF3137746.1 hypothetical protein TWF594_011875 [Orbilia oligospora]
MLPVPSMQDGTSGGLGLPDQGGLVITSPLAWSGAFPNCAPLLPTYHRDSPNLSVVWVKRLPSDKMRPTCVLYIAGHHLGTKLISFCFLALVSKVAASSKRPFFTRFAIFDSARLGQFRRVAIK